MKKFWRIVWLIISVCFCLWFSGCGYRELHERILIQGVGVDKTKDGYEVTVRAASSDEETKDLLYTCQGNTVLDALSNLSLTTGKEPFYSHNYLVVFGKSCGKEGLDQSMDFFIRYYNTRPAVQLYMAEDSAGEVLSVKQDNKLVPIQELQNLGQSGSYNGKAISMDFLEFVNSGQRPGSSPVAPVIGVRENRVEILGTAYFQDYKLVGILDLAQTRGFLAMKGDLKNGEVVVEGETVGKVTLTISQGKGKQEVDFQNSNPVFRTVYQVTADVSSLSGEQENLDSAFYTELEQQVAEQLREEMSSAWERALKKDQCDIFGFGNRFSQQFPEEWERFSQSWDDKMTDYNYVIEVDATVLRMEQGGLG